MRTTPIPPLGALLREIEYFGALSNRERALLEAQAVCRKFERKALISVQGEVPEGVYVVATGLVKLFRHSPDGREQTIRLVGPADSFHHISAFDGGPLPGSAMAIAPSAVYVLPRDLVNHLARTNPAFALAMLTLLSGQLRRFALLLEDISLRDTVGRVAHLLVQSIERRRDTVVGECQLSLLSQEEMAHIAGCARQVVNRALRVLERQGLIAVEQGRITVVDSHSLRALVS